MNKRRKRRSQAAAKHIEATTAAYRGPLPGLPGGPPYVRQQRTSGRLALPPRRGTLHLPERHQRREQNRSPISMFIRAQQAIKWGLPPEPKDER